MYIPKANEEVRVPVLHELIEAHPFTTLVTLGSAGLFASHIPMVLHRDVSTLWHVERSSLPRQRAVARFFADGGRARDLLRPASLHQSIVVSGKAGDRQGRSYVELLRCPRLWQPQDRR